MSSDSPIVAESSWFHRLFFRGPSRVVVSGETVRIDGGPGSRSVDIPIESIDAITVKSSWCRMRLMLEVEGDTEHRIGGLTDREATRVREAVLSIATALGSSLSHRVKSLNQKVTRFLAGKTYLRKSQSLILHGKLLPEIPRCAGLVREKMDWEAVEAFERLASLRSADNFEAARKCANDAYVTETVPSVQAEINEALSGLLTEEQAEAIATDEDATLVLAGAGTGKTAVIVGKAAHLVRNVGVSPEEILVLAFNKKAASEIRERLPKDLCRVQVSTMHAFGRRVIGQSDVAPTISKRAEDDAVRARNIQTILQELMMDPQQSRAVVRFIIYHQGDYRSPFDFTTYQEYEDHIRRVELRTLNGDRVKSFEELLIANFLSEHGIHFMYEAPYEFETATREHRQYHPDFFLPDYGVYIEHFALNEQGSPPADWHGYAEGVTWKRAIHQLRATRLIETYSWQRRRGILLTELQGKLEDAGVALERVSQEKLINALTEQQVSWLSDLLATFLNHVRGSDLKPSELRARARDYGDRQRNDGFLDVFDQVRARYERQLESEGALDFHDLINQAAELLRDGRAQPLFSYVLVDEFQDISEGRMRLLETLKRQGVAYFLVGDDWQSINRFAGSDVSLVRGCNTRLGHVQERNLTQTFRFSNGILSPSSAFVQRNPEQTQRPLRPATTNPDDGLSVIGCPRPEEGFIFAVKDIEGRMQDRSFSVLVLSRYWKSQDSVPRRGWHKSLKVDFSTVHGAKGREADYVIVLDLRDDKWGFPSRMEDDPLMDLVLPPVSGGAYPFAEERRLFYVAMTRARIGTYLIMDSLRPSTFVKELLRESDSVRQFGDLNLDIDLNCPRCTSGLLVQSVSGKTLRCSNYPKCEQLARLCPNCEKGYAIIMKESPMCRCTNPRCDQPPKKCPRCGRGIQVIRYSDYGPFLACSEYVSDPSCRFKRNLQKVYR